MSQAKHTPGPWAVHEHHAYVVPAGHERRYIGFAEDDEKDLRDFAQAICAIRWPDRHRPESEAKANARLIAAAPDLLEALAELVDLKAMKGGITTNAGIEEYERRKAPAWEAARAAVAKARGES